MKRTLLLLLALSCWTASCSEEKEGALLVCGYPLADTSGWRVWDEGVFSVSLPPEYQLTYRGGFDSYGGSWSAGNSTISYDFGSYSNRLDSESLPYSEILVTCRDGVANSTRLVIYRDTLGFGSASVAAYWEDVHPAGMIRTHLMMVGETSSLDSVATGEFLAVLATMKVAEPDAEWVGEVTGIVVTGERDTTRTESRE